MALVTVERTTSVDGEGSDGDVVYQPSVNFEYDGLTNGDGSVIFEKESNKQVSGTASDSDRDRLIIDSGSRCETDGILHAHSIPNAVVGDRSACDDDNLDSSALSILSQSLHASTNSGSQQNNLSSSRTQAKPSRTGTVSSTKCSLSASARLVRESFVVVKGAAVILSRSGEHSPPFAADRPSPEIQSHLQAIFNVLKPSDTIRAAVRLESNLVDRIKYVVVVYRIGMTDLEESIVLGIDILSPTIYANTNDAASTATTTRHAACIGVVLPLFADAAVKLDGDGGFSVSSNERCHIFKPLSIQAMWSALHTIDRAVQISRRNLFHPTGLSHTWTTVYEAMIAENDEILVADWNRLDEVEPTPGVITLQQQRSSVVAATGNPNCPSLNLNRSAQQTGKIEQSIRAKLKEIMLSVDLEEVNTKYLRDRLEAELATSMAAYRALIDEEAIVVMGQLEKASTIFDYLFLGSEWNASNWDELQANGVTHILNVSREVDCFFPAAFQYLTVRVYDTADADLLIYWDRTFRFIADAKRAGGRVLVHCKMGISRSASTVIAYCMKERGWSLADTVHYVKSRRACIKPNDNFMRQLSVYAGIVEASRQRHNPLFKNEFEDSQPPMFTTNLIPNLRNSRMTAHRHSEQLQAPIASRLARRRMESNPNCDVIMQFDQDEETEADLDSCFTNDEIVIDANAALMSAFKSDRPITCTRSLHADLADSRSADSRPDDDKSEDDDEPARRERDRIDLAVRSFAQSETQHMEIDMEVAADVGQHRPHNHHQLPRVVFGTYPVMSHSHRPFRNTILVLDPLRFNSSSTVSTGGVQDALARSRNASVSMSTASSSPPLSPMDKDFTGRSVDSQSDSDASAPTSVVLRRSSTIRDSYCRYRTAETTSTLATSRQAAISNSTLTVPIANANTNTNTNTNVKIMQAAPGPEAFAATCSYTSMEMSEESAANSVFAESRDVDIGVKMHYERENIPWQPGTVKRQSLCLEQRVRLSVVSNSNEAVAVAAGARLPPSASPTSERQVVSPASASEAEDAASRLQYQEEGQVTHFRSSLTFQTVCNSGSGNQVCIPGSGSATANLNVPMQGERAVSDIKVVIGGSWPLSLDRSSVKVADSRTTRLEQPGVETRSIAIVDDLQPPSSFTRNSTVYSSV